MAANRIVVVNNSPTIFRICINFAVLLVTVKLSLNSTKQNKKLPESEAKTEQMNMMSSALFLILYSFTICDISEVERALLGCTKFQKILGDTFLKFRIVN